MDVQKDLPLTCHKQFDFNYKVTSGLSLTAHILK